MVWVDLKLDQQTLLKIKRNLLLYNWHYSIVPLIFVLTFPFLFVVEKEFEQLGIYYWIICSLLGVAILLYVTVSINRSNFKKYKIIENGVLTKAIFVKWRELKNTEDKKFKLFYNYGDGLNATREYTKIDEIDKWIICKKSNHKEYVFLLELAEHLDLDLFAKISSFIPNENKFLR